MPTNYPAGYIGGAGGHYGVGNGAVITQQSNRTTGVVINSMCGTITTNTTSLAAEATAKFTVTNSAVSIADVIVLSIQSGSNSSGAAVGVSTVANGSFEISVTDNNASAGTAETGAILINFVVIKGAAS